MYCDGTDNDGAISVSHLVQFQPGSRTAAGYSQNMLVTPILRQGTSDSLDMGYWYH